jgi:hypothetical protein
VTERSSYDFDRLSDIMLRAMRDKPRTMMNDHATLRLDDGAYDAVRELVGNKILPPQGSPFPDSKRDMWGGEIEPVPIEGGKCMVMAELYGPFSDMSGMLVVKFVYGTPSPTRTIDVGVTRYLGDFGFEHVRMHRGVYFSDFFETGYEGHGGREVKADPDKFAAIIMAHMPEKDLKRCRW